jgi:hypothetical protein
MFIHIELVVYPWQLDLCLDKSIRESIGENVKLGQNFKTTVTINVVVASNKET